MKKSVIITAILLGLSMLGCGASGDASNGNASQSNAVAKEDVCSLLTTEEVSNLVGEAVNMGKLDTKHVYPHASVCTWTSVKHNMPRLVLTYYLNASSHDLDYYAPPGNAVKKLKGSGNEAVVVLTSAQELLEVIVRSGSNAILLMAPYLQAKWGSEKWKNEVKLTDLAADRAKGK